MRSSAPLLAVSASWVLGCADAPWPRPPAVAVDQFAADFHAWREDRRVRLVRPGSGAITWIGLWELHEGPAAFGADSTLPIMVTGKGVPPVAGTLERAGPVVRFHPARGTPVSLADGSPVRAPLALASDRTSSPTILSLASLRFRLHGEPGTDRLWLRGWDIEHPARETFALPDAFPPDTTWRVAARFDRFAEPRLYPVSDVTGGSQAYTAPGELVFRIGRREHRLAGFGDSTSRNFFVMFLDSTAATETYQGGRYLSVPVPGEDGWTVIDFNRAYNPPCVFTPYSVCALPPADNHLRLAVTAGEKRRVRSPLP